MAEKRMIAKRVVDSDAFLDMPQSAQNLYFHLNVRADDEGFIDNPKKIMRTVGSNQNDLEILLSKRYLLGFESGVIVIKHWKLHNCIRKDRLKPTVYQEERKQLFEKDNGSYTDRHMTAICQTVDGQEEADCQHRLDKYSIDEISIDKYSATPELSKRFETVKKTWNDAGLYEYKYLFMNIPSHDAKEIVPTFNVHEVWEICESIENYAKIKNSNQHELQPEYQGLIGFLKAGKGVDKFCDASKPFDRCKIKSKKNKTLEAAQKVYDSLDGVDL